MLWHSLQLIPPPHLRWQPSWGVSYFSWPSMREITNGSPPWIAHGVYTDAQFHGGFLALTLMPPFQNLNLRDTNVANSLRVFCTDKLASFKERVKRVVGPTWISMDVCDITGSGSLIWGFKPKPRLASKCHPRSRCAVKTGSLLVDKLARVVTWWSLLYVVIRLILWPSTMEQPVKRIWSWSTYHQLQVVHQRYRRLASGDYKKWLNKTSPTEASMPLLIHNRNTSKVIRIKQ